MKTDKLLRVLTKDAPNRSGRALPLPKYQGTEQSQTGKSLKKDVPKDLQDNYTRTQAAIQAMLDNPPQEKGTGMAPEEVMEYIKDRSIRTLMKENPSLGTTCQGPYCTTAASTALRLTYPNAAPLPTTGGNTFRDQILQNPAFGVTSNDIYSNLHPGSYLQQQTLEEYYEDEEGNTKQRSKPSYQSRHNMYIYNVENLPSGRKRIYTVQNTGNMRNPESKQVTKAYDVDKEGNVYSKDSDNIVIESARANAVDRPLLVYYKGNDVWSNPEMNSLLKQREDYKNQILQYDPEYFLPEKPTRYDVDYQPGQFVLPESFSSEQGKVVPSKNYKEFIDLRESKVPEIVDQVNNPEYKKMIMRDYNISDAEYNAAVKTMIGQYMMESQGGTDWQSGFRVPEHKGLAKFMTALGKDFSNTSIGPFQIKYNALSDKTKAAIPERGVSNKSKKEFVDFMYDPVKSSDIAMRYLAENIRTLRNLASQEGERQNMNPQNYLDFLPYMINQQGWLRRTDEESQSNKGSILGQGNNRYVQGIKEYGDMLLDYLPMSSDAMITNPPTIVAEKQRDGGPTTAKAKEILRDGSVHGQPLTDKQKRYFGWIAGGKKQDGGPLGQYQGEQSQPGRSAMVDFINQNYTPVKDLPIIDIVGEKPQDYSHLNTQGIQTLVKEVLANADLQRRLQQEQQDTWAKRDKTQVGSSPVFTPTVKGHTPYAVSGMEGALGAADVVSDLMQYGYFVPHPAAQTIGLVGSGLGSVIDSYQAGQQYALGNYDAMTANLASAGLSGLLASKGYLRDMYNTVPGSLADRIASLGSRSGTYRPLTAYPHLRNNPVIRRGLNFNRGSLGALGAETIYDLPEQKLGGPTKTLKVRIKKPK